MNAAQFEQARQPKVESAWLHWPLERLHARLDIATALGWACKPMGTQERVIYEALAAELARRMVNLCNDALRDRQCDEP